VLRWTRARLAIFRRSPSWIAHAGGRRRKGVRVARSRLRIEDTRANHERSPRASIHHEGHQEHQGQKVWRRGAAIGGLGQKSLTASCQLSALRFQPAAAPERERGARPSAGVQPLAPRPPSCISPHSQRGARARSSFPPGRADCSIVCMKAPVGGPDETRPVAAAPRSEATLG
jgi:hypothetical protein